MTANWRLLDTPSTGTKVKDEPGVKDKVKKENQMNNLIILGTFIDLSNHSYEVSIIDLSNHKAYLEHNPKSRIIEKLTNLGFKDMDNTAITYFLNELDTQMKKLDSNWLVPHENTIIITLNLTDLTWKVTLELDSSGKIFSEFIQHQFKSLDMLNYKYHNLVDLMNYKDHYMRYKRVQDPSDTNEEILAGYKKKNKHLKINFNLLESFDESKWKVEYQEPSENEIIKNGLKLINAIDTTHTPEPEVKPPPIKTEPKRVLIPKKKRQGIIKKKVVKP